MGLGPSAWALRHILDANLKFTKAGLKTFLRVENANDDDKEYPKFGFQRNVDPATTSSGFTDVEITPWPAVEAMSLHNIGLNAGKLDFGSHSFLISHTFVLKRMKQLGITEPQEVFVGPSVIGLFYNGRLYSIVSYVPETAGGGIVSWTVLGNAMEVAAPTT